MEKEWERLEEVLPLCWVAFKEYYEDGNKETAARMQKG